MREYNTIQNNISKWASRTKKNGCRRRRAPCAPGNVFLAVSFFLFRSLSRKEKNSAGITTYIGTDTHMRAQIKRSFM